VCTLVILYRPNHDWPLILAGNRDEMRDRPWRAPARHWEDRPEVVAGLDESAGGSWFGVNDLGVAAVVMNRQGTLGPVPDKRSRGELVLEALDHAEASTAAAALAQLDPGAYRAFNLVIADPVSVHWLCSPGSGEDIRVTLITPGLHMLSAGDLDTADMPRIRAYFPRFREAPVPEPETGHWQAWERLLASRLYSEDAGATAAMNFELASGFGTVCSQLLALPRYPGFGARARFLFAAGPPDRAPFLPVGL
jgi:uncharacterized protein with NRDE domain